MTPLQARGAVEAVFTTLRETIPHDEFVDVIAELPYEYASVGARPHDLERSAPHRRPERRRTRGRARARRSSCAPTRCRTSTPSTGRSLACFLDDPATRQHLAVATAAQRLGLLPVMLTEREVEGLRADPTGDTPRVLSAYAAGLVVGTLTQRALRELARIVTVPVINALSDEEDPIQALADLLTLRAHYDALEGLTIAYVGAADVPVAHSLMQATARTGHPPADRVPARARADRRDR